MNDYILPVGMKHYRKDEPLLSAWLGLLLLVDTLKVIFSVEPKHVPRHMRKDSLWQRKIVEKVDAFDIALDLLVYISSKLVSHFKRSLQEMRSEIRQSATRLYLKSAMWMIITTELIKMSIRMRLSSVRRNV